jgi:hypothetical protein
MPISSLVTVRAAWYLVVLGGSGVELDKLKGTPKKVLLDTGPLRSALRRFKRNALKEGVTGVPKRLARIPKNYRSGKKLIAKAKADGYESMTANDIKRIAEEN